MMEAMPAASSTSRVPPTKRPPKPHTSITSIGPGSALSITPQIRNPQRRRSAVNGHLRLVWRRSIRQSDDRVLLLWVSCKIRSSGHDCFGSGECTSRGHDGLFMLSSRAWCRGYCLLASNRRQDKNFHLTT
jgi:hypothetical protein